MKIYSIHDPNGKMCAASMKPENDQERQQLEELARNNPEKMHLALIVPLAKLLPPIPEAPEPINAGINRNQRRP